MTCQLPEGVRYRRDDDGDVVLVYQCSLGLREISLDLWLQDNCAPGTEAQVIQNGWGEISAVALQPPTSYAVPDTRTAARRFRLVRHQDVSGVSGTGVVAHGVEWPDGTVSMRWSVPGLPAAFANWDSIEAIMLVHGHEGATEVEWID